MTNNGLINHAATTLMSSANGTKINLLTKEPLATRHTTGNSRSARTPLTCCAFNARSSPNTPAVFLAAILLMTATSSKTVAMSSNKSNKLLAIALLSLCDFLSILKLYANKLCIYFINFLNEFNSICLRK